jgi:hypothetical protein
MNFVRKCKTCGGDIFHKNERSFKYAIKTNGNCKKCAKSKASPNGVWEKNELWYRNCPSCKKEIEYIGKYAKNISINCHNKLLNCEDCSNIEISKKLTGRKIPDEVKKKISNTLIEKFNTPKYKEKFKIQNGGQNNSMYGKIHTEESKKKMSDNTKLAIQSDDVKEKFYKSHQSKEFKEKISKIHKGKTQSEESRRKMREAIVRRVKKYGIHSRSFNPKACEIIDDYGKTNGYNFQHALNGGEISCAGYMVDGYDKEKNVVIEIDEKQHFDFDGNLKEKDVKRQKEIENELKCKFIRLPFIKS